MPKFGLLQRLLNDNKANINKENLLDLASHLTNFYFVNYYKDKSECDYILGKTSTLVCLDLLQWLISSKTYFNKKTTFTFTSSIARAKRKLYHLKVNLYFDWINNKYSHKIEEFNKDKKELNKYEKEYLDLLTRYKNFTSEEVKHIRTELGL